MEEEGRAGAGPTPVKELPAQPPKIGCESAIVEQQHAVSPNDVTPGATKARVRSISPSELPALLQRLQRTWASCREQNGDAGQGGYASIASAASWVGPMLNMLAYGCSARIGAGYPRDEVDDAAGGSEVDDDAQGKEQSERYGVTWWMVENSSCHIDLLVCYDLRDRNARAAALERSDREKCELHCNAQQCIDDLCASALRSSTASGGISGGGTPSIKIGPCQVLFSGLSYRTALGVFSATAAVLGHEPHRKAPFTVWIAHEVDAVREAVDSYTLPQEYSLGALSVEDIPAVASTWAYASAYTNAVVNECIACRPSVCVRSEGTGHAVSWCLLRTDHSIGMLYTVEQHRGKGLGKFVAATLVLALIEMHGMACAASGHELGAMPVPFAFIAEESTTSQHIFGSLGFVPTETLWWTRV